ncbi:MAG TPA: hypothetical protein DCQ31_14960 [Bacteroidales bacterium]|nr:hypothetical protein [Bacteroidales bacterium]
MEKLIEDLLLRLEQQKCNVENTVNDVEPNTNNALVFLNAGKIIAYDFAINELRRMLQYYNENKGNMNVKK